MTPSLAQHRALHASLAAQHRWNADRAEAKGLHDLARFDRAAADREQRAANAISLTMLAVAGAERGAA